MTATMIRHPYTKNDYKFCEYRPIKDFFFHFLISEQNETLSVSYSLYKDLSIVRISQFKFFSICLS